MFISNLYPIFSMLVKTSRLTCVMLSNVHFRSMSPFAAAGACCSELTARCFSTRETGTDSLCSVEPIVRQILHTYIVWEYYINV